MRSILVGALLILCHLAPSAEPAAAAQGPGQGEVEVLCLLNQLRTNFRVGESVIVEAIRSKRVEGVAEQMWGYGDANQAAKPCPLVLSAQLNEAARKALATGVTLPDKKEYDATAEVRAAGYAAADKGATLLYAVGAPDLHTAFARACTVVVRADNNGTYTILRYAGYVTCRSAWREAGIAVATGKDGSIGVAIVLGTGAAPRLIGGIAYLDANRNGRFDHGEGRPGVTVTSGAAKVQTGPGGAWWMDGQTGAEQKVTIGIDGFQGVRTVAATAGNAFFEWRIPVASEVKVVDKLIADAEAVSAVPDMDKRVGPLSALLAGARMTTLDDVRAEKVAKLIEPVLGRYESTRDQVLDALGESPAEAGKLIAAQRKAWNGALPAFFKEAATLPTLRQQVNAIIAGPPANAAKLAKPLLAQLAKAMAATQEPTFLRLYDGWRTQLEAAVPAGPEPKKTGAPKK